MVVAMITKSVDTIDGRTRVLLFYLATRRKALCAS